MTSAQNLNNLKEEIILTRKIYTGKKTTSSGPYSHAVDASDYLFFSGQTAHNAVGYSGETYDIATQTEMCFAHLKDVMDEAGNTLEDVVKVNVYLTGMKHFDEMNAVYTKMFNEPFPAKNVCRCFGIAAWSGC